MDEDLSSRKKTVGTHTSYMSCCLFPGSDNQVLTGSGDATCALWVKKIVFWFCTQFYQSDICLYFSKMYGEIFLI